MKGEGEFRDKEDGALGTGAKKKVAGESMVGTGLLLKVSSQKAVDFFCFSLLVHVAGWQSSELWLQPEGSWLQRKFLFLSTCLQDLF